MVESQPSKLLVASSILVSRSKRLSRFSAALLLFALAGSAICQAPQPPDIEKSFESLFRSVESLKGVPRGAIGLTEAEGQVLTDIANDWVAKGRAYSEAERLLRREAFFQSIEADEYPAKVVERRAKELAQRVADLQVARARGLQEQLQKLRASLGVERFQTVEAFVRSKAPDSPFFPLPPGQVVIEHRPAKK